MRYQGGRPQKQAGFTIVELLIVIVVIAVLAAITIVAYNGVKDRANDSTRKSDVASIAKVLALYTAASGNQLIDATAGCGRHGAGWWTGPYDGYPSVYDCMRSAGYTNLPELDPAGTAYMKAVCTKNGEQVSYVLAKLATVPQNANFMESICDGPQASNVWVGVLDWDTAYGMNYGVRIAR